ncbi:Transcriptional repressor rco-1 [Cladobotryum mycophilum]|uniref:Transcriptional repressor rco-1 n=1 Tax=Cladobotryum mycophilum TaxID=491253 RepID=A0ABR0SB81_9HYPO
MQPSTTSVSHLTQECVSKFEHLMQNGSIDNESLQGRWADFNLWADGVGAMAKLGASLDSRFRSRPDDLDLVKSILSMLADFLDEYSDGLIDGGSTDEGFTHIDSCIKNLAMIGVAIRRTGKASRSRRADQSFNPDKHQSFRRHLECIVLLRPKDDRASNEQPSVDQPRLELLDISRVNELVASRMDELGSSKLNELQKRLVEANLRRRHRFLLAQKRSQHAREVKATEKRLDIIKEPTSESRLEEINSSNQTDLVILPPGPSKSQIKEHAPPPTLAGFSTASTAEGTLRYNLTRRYQSAPTVARSQISLIAAETEFPKPPLPFSDRLIYKCPCCCQSLPSEEFTDSKRWRQHLIDDLCPYTCIAEYCPTPHLLFATRKAWETHIEKDHPPQWQCPLCDEMDVIFPIKEDIIDHIQTQHQEELSSHDLSSLVSWSAVQSMGILSCPLCSSHGPRDSPELVDHVVRHAYEFALRALPWTSLPLDDLNKPIGIYSLPEKSANAESLEKWIDEAFGGAVCENPDSLPLSSFDRADHTVPPISDLTEGNDYFVENPYFEDQESANSSKPQSVQARSSIALSQSSRLDMPADSTIQGEDNDGQMQLLMAVQIGDETIVRQLLDEGVDINSRNDVGRTVLFRAAENGEEAMVKLLLDLGADAQLEDDDGQTPLSRATDQGHEAIIKLLEKNAGIDVNDDFDQKPMVETRKLWDLDIDSISSEYKKVGKDWSAVFNPDINRVLDVDLKYSFNHEGSVLSVNFSHDGRYIATGCKGSAQILDLQTGKRADVLKHGSYKWVRSVCFSPNGQYLATGGEDRLVRVWDIATGTIRHNFSGHQDVISSIDFASDGCTIASGSWDNTVRLWDIVQGTNTFTFTVEDQAFIVAISHDSKFVAAGLGNGKIHVWDITSRVMVGIMSDHKGIIHSIKFSPNGKELVSGSRDGPIKMWEFGDLRGPFPNDLKCARTLDDHKGDVNSVALTPDHKWFLSGSDDKGVQIWDSQTGIPQLLLRGHTDYVMSVACSPQGGYFATGSSDKMVRIWSYNNY